MIGVPQPKARPKLLDKREQQREATAYAKAENQIVRRRSVGRCEVYEGRIRCGRAGAHYHHILFRSRGGGDEAANKLHCCERHHSEIHQHVLVLQWSDEQNRAGTVRCEWPHGRPGR